MVGRRPKGSTGGVLAAAVALLELASVLETRHGTYAVMVASGLLAKELQARILERQADDAARGQDASKSPQDDAGMA